MGDGLLGEDIFPGLGGMDVFCSKRLDDTWTNWSVPKNLGKEVNSLGSDWGYTISMNPVAWDVFTSKADLNTERNDIYTSVLPTFARPKKVIPYSGVLVKAGTKTGVAAKIVVTNSETGVAIDTIFTRPEGGFTLKIPEGTQQLEFFVEGENLFPQSKVVLVGRILASPGMVDTIEVNTIPEMIEHKKPVSLNTITFDYDKSELRPESYPELNRLYNLFVNETWRVEISGHTDDAGTPEYNKALSLRRAEAVKAFLVDKGLAEARLSIRGYGAEKPVADNKTEEGRGKNRRVEIVIQ